MDDKNVQLQTLIDHFGGRLVGNAKCLVSGIAPLESATSSQISFLSNSKSRQHACETHAAALILAPSDEAFIQRHYRGSQIIVDNPYAYFARVAQFFFQRSATYPLPGHHPTVIIDPTAHIAQSASIGAHVVIGAHTVIEDHVVIQAGCVIGQNIKIGAHSHLYPHVTIYNQCNIGQHAIVHSGVVIGADGFGFANETGNWIKIPQTGGVRIGHEVEIGANTTIDRGALTETVIEDGVKLDNQIQIAHNCRIGAHTAIAACVGIAGSTSIGKYCSIGGAAMIGGHLTLVDHVHISGGTSVFASILTPGRYTSLYPTLQHREWEKSAVLVRNLHVLRDKIRYLEHQLQIYRTESMS